MEHQSHRKIQYQYNQTKLSSNNSQESFISHLTPSQCQMQQTDDHPNHNVGYSSANAMQYLRKMPEQQNQGLMIRRIVPQKFSQYEKVDSLLRLSTAEFVQTKQLFGNSHKYKLPARRQSLDQSEMVNNKYSVLRKKELSIFNNQQMQKSLSMTHKIVLINHQRKPITYIFK